MILVAHAKGDLGDVANLRGLHEELDSFCETRLPDVMLHGEAQFLAGMAAERPLAHTGLSRESGGRGGIEAGKEPIHGPNEAGRVWTRKMRRLFTLRAFAAEVMEQIEKGRHNDARRFPGRGSASHELAHERTDGNDQQMFPRRGVP